VKYVLDLNNLAHSHDVQWQFILSINCSGNLNDTKIL